MSEPENGAGASREPLGVLMVGVKGAVATTTIAGVVAAARGLVTPRGLLTESPAAAGVPLAPLTSLRFGGWDIAPGSVPDAARAHGIVPEPVLDAVEDALRETDVFPGVLHGVSARVRDVAGASSSFPQGTLRAAAERVVAQIRSFRAIHETSRVVVVNLASTEAATAGSGKWATLDEFEAALDADDARVTAGEVYAYAALRAGSAYVNFTPSATMESPALVELAKREGVPFAGKDGKTGQTAYKSTLATLFKSRDLRVRGWFSHNLLGNRDGAVLADPEHAAAKLASKRGGLEGVLGYSDFAHEVRIDYYAPRGDWKEARDVIDFEGWLGTRMSMRVSWLGEDSALAAPLVVDLARLADLARRRGESGALPHLAFFFKSPYGTPAGALADEYASLVAYLEAAKRTGAGPRRVPVRRTASPDVPET